MYKGVNLGLGMITMVKNTFQRNEHCLLFREYLSHHCEIFCEVLFIVN